MTKEELIERIKDCTVILEGGGDSGYISVEDIRDSALEEIIRDRFYSICDYGSFTGNFSVFAEGGFDAIAEEIIIEGQDESRYDSTVAFQEELTFNIPSNIFDSYSIFIDSDYGNHDVSFNLNIKNGLWLPEYDKLESEIEDKILNILGSYSFDSIYEDHINDLSKEDIEIKFDIQGFNYVIKDIFFNLGVDEILELYNNE